MLAWRYLNTMLLTNYENLNSITNIFHETHDILVLTDPLIICIYLRTTDRHFRDQGNVHYPISELVKCDLVQTLNTFWNPSLVEFITQFRPYHDILSLFVIKGYYYYYYYYYYYT